MSIASRIEAIEQHLTDDYDVLTLAGADLTNVDKNIVNLKPTWKERLLYFMNNGTDVVWENWDKVVGEGTSLTLNNTLEGKMSIVLKGNTSQDSTTGKNLYDDIYSDYTRPLDYIICPITLEQGQTYTLSSTLIGTKVTGIIVGIVPSGEKYTDFSTRLIASVDSGGNAYTRTIRPDETWTSPKLVLYVGSSPSTLESTFDSIFENYHTQLEKGNTATSYETYTNGASPNPDYPQPIQVVSGDNEITICGKNFFDVSKVNNLALSGTVVSNPTYRGYSLKVSSGETYTISRKEATLPNRFRVCFTKIEPANNVDFYGENGVMQSYVELGSVTSGTVTVPSEMNYMFLYLSNNNETITTEMEIQIEKGNQLSSYEEYTGATYSINLGKNILDFDTFLTSGGATYTKNDNEYSITDIGNLITNRYDLKLQPNTTYTLSCIEATNGSSALRIQIFEGSTYKYRVISNGSSEKSVTFTTNNSSNYYMNMTCKGTISYPLVWKNVMLERGNQVTTYAPYFTPIELCKIGTYQDKIFKNTPNTTDYDSNLEDNVWYVKNEIVKFVLDGSENCAIANTGTTNWYYYASSSNIPAKNIISASDGYCTYYTPANIGNNTTNQGILLLTSGVLRVRYGTEDTKANWETWLSTNKPVLYYPVANPTYTLIEDSTLISQLEALKSKTGQTNISQTNNDLPFELSVSALGELNG